MTTLCHIDDIPEGSSKGFDGDKHNVFIVKKDGEVFIYNNSCPHLGVELNWQEDQFFDRDNALIQCSTHGALFIIESGQCVAGPCMGEHLQPIPFELIEGHIVI
jgi:nitrite reductase/ring-hydroxylating ferredoxin subunit